MNEAGREERAQRLALWVLLGLTAIRLAICGFVGLGDAEAYYWTWAKHLDLSYYDHPPLVAYLIAATTALGGDHAFFVRLGPVLLFAATSWIVFLLGRDLSGSPRAGLRALLLLQMIPVFALGGQGANPDVPLGFFWVLTLWLLWRATTGDVRRLAWPAGLALGLAFLSKYFAVVLALAAMMWLLRPEHRRWFRRPALYGAILLAAACAVPVLLWNVEHDWPSVRYHFGRHSAAGLSWKQAGMFLGGQGLYYSPFLWGGLLWALVATIRRGWGRAAGVASARPWAFLATAALPPLILFTFIGLWTPEAEPHWTAMGYLPLVVAAAMLFPERWNAPPSRGRTAFRWFTRVAVGLPVLLLVAVHVHLLSSWLVPLVPERDRPRDLMAETSGWDEVGRRTLAVAAKMDRPFLLHYHYTKCSQLSWAVRGRIPLACLNDRMDQFDFWLKEADLRGRNALYVTDSVYAKRPEQVWRFDRCTEDAPLVIRRGGYNLRRFTFWRCQGYRGPAPGRKNL